MTKLPIALLASPKLAFLKTVLVNRYTIVPVSDAPTGSRLREEASVIIAGGDGSVSAELMDTCPRLLLIACMTVGYECVDVQNAVKRRLIVTHGADAPAGDVADFALGLIIAATRGIMRGDRMVRSSQWVNSVPFLTRSLRGLRVGIVGLGTIGTNIALRCQSLGLAVHWWGPNAKADAAWPYISSVIALADQSDVLVLAARSEYGAPPLIGRREAEAIGSNGVLVNVARGSLVDEPAIISALQDGRLGGAALDVFASEPTQGTVWAGVPNVILTPHIAGGTQETLTTMIELMCDNIDAVLAGSAPISPIREVANYARTETG